MKKILITGCSGYIGSHLSKMLANDYEVHGLDIDEPQAPLNEFYRCDINRPFAIPGDIEYDSVIHLAALVRVGESEIRDSVSKYMPGILITNIKITDASMGDENQGTYINQYG